MTYWVDTLFKTVYKQHTYIQTRAKIGLKKNLYFTPEAPTLIVIMSGTICRQATEVFPALKQNFGSHKFKDESETEKNCNTVVSTHDTVFHQQGTEKLLSGYYAYVAGTI
jgi:hypothetical protein